MQWHRSRSNITVIRYDRLSLMLPELGLLTRTLQTLGGGPSPVVGTSQTSTQNKRQSMLPQSFSQQQLPLSQPSVQTPASAPAAEPAPTTQTLPYHPPQPDSFSAPYQPPYPTSANEKAPLNPPAMTGSLAPQPSPLPPPTSTFQSHLPPLKPVFGVSLNDLYARDGTAVPMIVYQCFQAIELFGLDMEGIYRLSGSANHISQMKALFDNGKSYCVRIHRWY